MLTLTEARELAAHWREQFADAAEFERSWSKFFELTGDPTPDKLEHWLAKDQAKDAVRHAGIVSEPLLPVRQDLPDFLGDCPTCGGNPGLCSACHGLGHVRRDLPVGHPDFGKAIPCPRCSHAH